MFETGERVYSEIVPGKRTIALLAVFFAVQLSLEWIGFPDQGSFAVLVWISLIMLGIWEHWEVVKKSSWVLMVTVALVLTYVALLVFIPWKRLSYPGVCAFALGFLVYSIIARRIVKAKKTSNSEPAAGAEMSAP